MIECSVEGTMEGRWEEFFNGRNKGWKGGWNFLMKKWDDEGGEEIF